MGDVAQEDWKDLREALAGEGRKRISDVLKQPEVRQACAAGLEAIGCRAPANHLVLFCFEKVLVGASGLLGAAAASRLEELGQRLPIVRDLLSRIMALDRQEQDRDRLKDRLLETLAELGVDRETSVNRGSGLDVLTAIYNQRKLEALDARFDGMLEGMRDGVASMLADIDRTRNEPALGWNLQTGPIASRSLTDTIRYNSGQHPFQGRQQDLDLLHRLCGDPTAQGPLARFSWLLVTGAGGEGKSRLALEFTQGISKTWRAGRLDFGDLERFDAGRWRPRRPTFIVIDYPAQAPDKVHAMLVALQANAEDFDWPVRVLLLERTAEGEWFERLLPPTSAGAALRGQACRIDGVPVAGWRLPPLATDEVLALMRGRFESLMLEPPSDEILLAAAARLDPRDGRDDAGAPRALFAMAATEALILARADGEVSDAEVADTLERSSVFADIIDRDRQTRWRKTAAGADARRLELHENLFALATLCLGLPMRALSEVSERASRWLPDHSLKGVAPLDDELVQAMTGGSGGRIANLEPDILGEFYVLDRLKRLAKRHGEAAADDIRDAALAIAGDQAGIFILRCVADFGDEALLLVARAPEAAAPSAARRGFARLSNDLTAILGGWRPLTAIEALTEQLDALWPRLADDPEARRACAMALLAAILQLGRREYFSTAETAFNRLALRIDAGEADAELFDLALNAARLVVFCVSVAGFWTIYERMLAKLEAWATRWPKSVEAGGALAHAYHHGINGHLKEVLATREATDLQALFDSTVGVGLVEVGIFDEEAGTDGADVLFDRLSRFFFDTGGQDDVGRAFYAAAATLISDGGQRGDEDRVDKALRAAKKARQQYTLGAQARIGLATAFATAFNYGLRTAQWDRADEAYGQLWELYQIDPNEPSVRGLLVLGLTNLQVYGRDAPGRESAAWDTLAAIHAQFPDDAVVAGEHAKMRFNRGHWAFEAGDAMAMEQAATDLLEQVVGFPAWGNVTQQALRATALWIADLSPAPLEHALAPILFGPVRSAETRLANENDALALAEILVGAFDRLTSKQAWAAAAGALIFIGEIAGRLAKPDTIVASMAYRAFEVFGHCFLHARKALEQLCDTACRLERVVKDDHLMHILEELQVRLYYFRRMQRETPDVEATTVAMWAAHRRVGNQLFVEPEAEAASTQKALVVIKDAYLRHPEVPMIIKLWELWMENGGDFSKIPYFIDTAPPEVSSGVSG